LGQRLPDPIEERFISELADLEPEQVQLLSMAMNQILKMMDSKGVEEAPFELHNEPVAGSAEMKLFP
jgi:hypothetical protein